MGWNINFGVIFGGERSVGDLGYQSMIKNDFISAVDEFQEFIDENPRHIKKLKAQKMLEFCKKQKPYQEFENGNNAFGRYDLDQAARWYEGALRTANDDLSFEIIVKQKELALILLDSALVNLETLGFNKSEKLIRKAKALTPTIKDKSEKYLSELYLRKGDVFFEVSNFEVALQNYEKAYLYDKKIRSVYINKVKEVTDAILDEANDAKDKGDILFASSRIASVTSLTLLIYTDLIFLSYK
jgi:tetratricopeptide (TPR) repeat protein